MTRRRARWLTGTSGVRQIRLETEKQGLQQQLEDMRATYQLNTEKLEYNHRVLHERNDENRSTMEANKRP